MNKTNGVQFEMLVHEIFTALASSTNQYTNVERNVHLDSPDGPRQIDILIRSNAAGIPLKIVIECRITKGY